MNLFDYITALFYAHTGVYARGNGNTVFVLKLIKEDFADGISKMLGRGFEKI